MNVSAAFVSPLHIASSSPAAASKSASASVLPSRLRESPLRAKPRATGHAILRAPARLTMSHGQGQGGSDDEVGVVSKDSSKQTLGKDDESEEDEDQGDDAADKSTTKPARKYSLRTRLREETEAPFRKARMFVYLGSAASASVGAFISALRIIAALIGTSGVQPLNETIPNVAIDLGVIALCALLLRYETRAGEKRMQRMSRGARIANLRVEDGATRRVAMLKEMRGQDRVILVAGTCEKVEQTMKAATNVKSRIEDAGLLVVPYIVDNYRPDDDPLRTAVSESLRRAWRYAPFAVAEWREWYNSERDAVKNKLNVNDDVLVIIIRLDGKVGARTVGTPVWEKLLDQVSRLPTKDQYGRP